MPRLAAERPAPSGHPVSWKEVEAPPVQQAPFGSYEHYQSYVDGQQLRLISLLSLIYGGVMVLFSCFFLLYVFMGEKLANDPKFFRSQTEAPPPFFGQVVMIMGMTGFVLGLLRAGLSVYAGKCLRERKNWTWLMVIACFDCLSFPLGTGLGIFTIVVINRPSVRALFSETSSPQLY